MDFLAQRKKQLGIKSLGDMARSGDLKTERDPLSYVHGPQDFDFLHHRWARQEVLGIIGGSGSGKSSILLYFYKEMLQNAKDPNSICVFFSLEMTAQQIYNKWINLIGDDTSLSDRFFVVENCDEEGKPRDLSTQGILNECLKIKNGLGVDILSVGIDHLQIISTNGVGDGVNDVCKRIKAMSIELNTLMVILSQTTKVNQAEYSDLPLFRSDSYGGSGFTWYTTWIISIHQPLKRVYDVAKLPVLAWAYVKIQNGAEEDGAVENKFRLMYYDLNTGTPRYLNREELALFNHYWSLVLAKREADDKFKGKKIPSYDVKDSVEGFTTQDRLLIASEELSELDGDL